MRQAELSLLLLRAKADGSTSKETETLRGGTSPPGSSGGRRASAFAAAKASGYL